MGKKDGCGGESQSHRAARVGVKGVIWGDIGGYSHPGSPGEGTGGGSPPPSLLSNRRVFGDFGDFGVSFVATVAGRYTRRGAPRLSVQNEPLLVLTRGP